jgi:hypothetical protein
MELQYQSVLAAAAMVVVLYIAMRLSRSIRKDREEAAKARRRNVRRGPRQGGRGKFHTNV